MVRPINDQVISNFPAQISSTSPQIWTSFLYRASVQLTVSSGTLNGTLTVQGSNDLASGAPPSQFLPTNWTSLGSISVICSSTVVAPTSFIIPVFDCSYEYLRLSYVAGNSGNTNGVYSARIKGLNG